MVHIYYHIYAIEGVESIIDEQLDLIHKHFDFPFKLNVGISIAHENVPSKPIIDKFYNYKKPNYKIRDIRCKGNEFVTLDLIKEDVNLFGDSDYIFYFHTKGASKINHAFYQYILDWRNLLDFFNIQKVKNVFNIFEKTKYNTYGINLLNKVYNELPTQMYGGNYWWAKSDYIKTINTTNTDKYIRVDAEINFIQNGTNWNPFSAFDSNVNHYYEPFPKEKYR